MKFIKYIFLILLIFSCNDSNSDNSETSELDGVWIGTLINIPYPNEFTFIFNDNYLEINGFYDIDGNDLPITATGSFTLNNDLDPNQMDLTLISYTMNGDSITEYLGLVSLCIYQIDGDILSFSGAEPGTTRRPSDFSGDEGEMQVYILTRD